MLTDMATFDDALALTADPPWSRSSSGTASTSSAISSRTPTGSKPRQPPSRSSTNGP